MTAAKTVTSYYGNCLKLVHAGIRAPRLVEQAELKPETMMDFGMAVQRLNKPDPRILSILIPIEVAALLTVVALAAAILALWFVPNLDAWAPPIWSQMTANAAIGMCSAAAALLFSARHRLRDRAVGRVAACLVLAIGLLSLAEYVFPISIGIDTWLPHARVGVYPGRPSPQTSIGLVLLGTWILTINKDERERAMFADVLALVLVALDLVMIGGRLYGALGLTGVNVMTILSPQTLCALSCLVFVIAARSARRGGLLGVLVNAGVGSRIVRAGLAPAIVLPLLFFACEDYVIQSNIMSAPYAHAVGSASVSFLILCLISRMGWRLNALEVDLREASLIDELTSIYNRRGFYFLGEQAVREAQRETTGLTLFFFDLNGLKSVNDTLGHEAGSNLISDFSTIITKSFRKTDIVGRVGGDEFAVLTIRDVGLLRQKVLSQIAFHAADCNRADPRKPLLTFSVGITELVPGVGDSLEAMLGRADALMYQDKALQREAQIA